MTVNSPSTWLRRHRRRLETKKEKKKKSVNHPREEELQINSSFRCHSKDLLLSFLFIENEDSFTLMNVVATLLKRGRGIQLFFAEVFHY